MGRRRTPNSMGEFLRPSLATGFAVPGGTSLSGNPGEQTGRLKLTDNNNPFPQDRVFFDYSFYNHTRLAPNGADVNRFTPGIEKTFLDGDMSFEVRTPMAVTTSSAFNPTSADLSNGEFGNIGLAIKALLYQDNCFAFTAGLGIQLPTADDNTVVDGAGNVAVLVENESVHLLPYIAFLRERGDFFSQFYVQIDTPVGGNQVRSTNTIGGTLTSVGDFEDQTFLYVDYLLGAWLLRDRSTGNGLAVSTEVHYSSTIDSAQTRTAPSFLGTFVAAPINNDIDLVNMTFGAHVSIGDTIGSVGYGVPITDDRSFEGELRVILNRFF